MIRKTIITAVATLLLGTWSPLLAQEMEMNSANPAALTYMGEAFAFFGHEMDQFEPQVISALEADPDMVVANFFMAIKPDASRDDGRPYAQRVANYQGEMSPGEQQMQEMCSHYDDKDYDIEGAFVALAAMYPNDARLNLLIGTMYMYQEQADEALLYLERAREVGSLPGTHNILGYAYLQKGDMESAQASFEAYLAAAPESSNPYDSMGDYLMAVKDYKGAAEHFERAAAMNPAQPVHAQKAEQARDMMN